MQILTKFLDECKIGKQEFFDFVLNAEDDELAEFINDINIVIDESYGEKKENNGFTFIANSTLSGLSFPCGEVECKINNVSKLVRNSILYADIVYLQNPFESYLRYESFNEKLRFDIINDLIVFEYIKPVLKAGIFRIAKSNHHFCHDCYNKFEKEYLNTFNYNLETIKPLLIDYIAENIDFHLIKSNGITGVELSGENDLIQHPMVINFLKHIPKNLERMVITEQKRKLSKRSVRSSGIISYLIQEIEENIAHQDFYSKYYSAHILTDRDFDINLLKLINKSTYQENIKKSEVLQNLNHMVPFVENVPIKKLLKLRSNEGEAFQVYRDKLNKIVKSESLTIQDSKDLYLDEIRPELNKINHTLKDNKKLLWGNIQSNVFLASTYISTSLYAGILPQNIDQIVASIGGFGFAKSIGEDILKLLKKPEIRKNEFYFLWKLKNEEKIKI